MNPDTPIRRSRRWRSSPASPPPSPPRPPADAAEGRAGAVRDRWRSCPARRGSTSTTRQILRLASIEDIVPAGELLADGTGPDDGRRGRRLRSATCRPARWCSIGIIDNSCTPAKAAGLVRVDDGDLAMFAPGHVPEPIECFVANSPSPCWPSHAADAPPGSADGAELVHFRFVGFDNPPAARPPSS